jgi:predicted DNA-binding protein (MmcQ/YjbR family)
LRVPPMNLDSLRKYCATLPGATHDIKWGADEVYSVGGKMFAVFCVERGKAKTASFKCDPERFLELTDQPGVVPAPYLARAHWVQLQDAKALTDAAARGLVARSQSLVFAKLTRKEQASISEQPPPTHRKPRP